MMYPDTFLDDAATQEEKDNCGAWIEVRTKYNSSGVNSGHIVFINNLSSKTEDEILNEVMAKGKVMIGLSAGLILNQTRRLQNER